MLSIVRWIYAFISTDTGEMSKTELVTLYLDANAILDLIKIYASDTNEYKEMKKLISEERNKALEVVK